MGPPDELPAWATLGRLASTLAGTDGDELAGDLTRQDSFSRRLHSIRVDFSRQRINKSTLAALLELAQQSGCMDRIQSQFVGEEVNTSEHRGATHTWLRAESPDASHSPQPFLEFADAVRRGSWTGTLGHRISTVVHIGIGGSYAGPQFICDALANNGPAVRFVTNVDQRQLNRTLRQVNAAESLFVVASKSFTTDETISNAQSIFRWFKQSSGDQLDPSRHWVLVGGDSEAISASGLPHANHYHVPASVGGRFSVWSAVGVSSAISLGSEKFLDLLKGAREVDTHVSQASLADNIPLLLALLDLWNTNFLGATTQALLTYDDRLRYLVPHVQQLYMESLGKSARVDGQQVQIHTSPVIWGGPETDAQHSFHQLLHQGTRAVSCELFGVVGNDGSDVLQQRWMLANCLAQADLLFRGANSQTYEQHQHVTGNTSNTVFLLDQVDAFTLGMLLAMYEHKVALLGYIWGINPFDQWGVAHGKQLADSYYRRLGGDAGPSLSPSAEISVRKIRDKTQS